MQNNPNQSTSQTNPQNISIDLLLNSPSSNQPTKPQGNLDDLFGTNVQFQYQPQSNSLGTNVQLQNQPQQSNSFHLFGTNVPQNQTFQNQTVQNQPPQSNIFDLFGTSVPQNQTVQNQPPPPPLGQGYNFPQQIPQQIFGNNFNPPQQVPVQFQYNSFQQQVPQVSQQGLPNYSNLFGQPSGNSYGNPGYGYNQNNTKPQQSSVTVYNDDDELSEQHAKQINSQSNIIIQLKARQKVIQLNQDIVIPSMCTIKTEGGNRTSVDLICVIDVSGSMSGKKINLVKQTLNYLLGQLSENDRLCLIAFNYGGTRLCTLLKNNQKNRSQFDFAIKSLYASGGTNIMSGMNLALKMIKERKYQNTVTSIFLLSDGQDGAALQGFKNSLVGNTDMFSVHSFGFGDDHDPKLMTEFAKIKDGNFYYIQELSTLDEAFVNALGGLFSIVAQKLKITIERCTKGKYSDIRIKKTYGFMWKNNEEVYTIELGQLVSGVSKDFVFQIEIPALNIDIGDYERNQSIVSAFYEAYDTNEKKLQGKAVLSFTFLNESQKLLQIDEDAGVMQNYLRVKAAEVIEINMKKAQNKQYKEAKGSIDLMVQQIQKNKKVSQQKMAPLVHDLQKLSQTCVQQKYEEVGKNMWNCVGYQHMAQNNFNYSNAQQAQMFGNLQAQKMGPGQFYKNP